jgi:hypothetical protein
MLPKYEEMARYTSFAKDFDLSLDKFEGKGLPAVEDDLSSSDGPPLEVCDA